MKISKIFAIILGIVSLGLAFGSLAFMDWDKTAANYDLHNQFKLYSILLGAFMLVFVIIAIAKKNKGVIVPLLAFVPTGIYFVKKLYEINHFNQSIIDVISPADSTTVLTLLLFIGFIACVIASVIKNNKYTKFYVIGYFALLILSSFKFLPDITMNKDLLPITMIAYSMVVGYGALLLFFIPGKDSETTETKATETEAEETKAEETKADAE